MAKKRRKPTKINPHQGINLDSIRGTSETPQGTLRKKVKEKGYQDIPPPFKGEEEEEYIKKSDVSLIGKVAVIAISTIGVLSTIVWYASQVNGDVQRLKTDVSELKTTTKNLKNETRANENRINKVTGTLEAMSREK